MAAVGDAIDGLPEALRKQLYPLVEEAEGDLKRFRSSVETSFDDSMQRVSGWYKRRAQLIVYIVAALVTVGLNVDTIRVTDRLWDDDALRQSVVGAAIETARGEQGTASSGTTVTASTSTEPPCGVPDASATEGSSGDQAGSLDEVDQAVAETKACLDQLEELTLPIGWSAANDDWLNPPTIVGWLITFFALSLGAPFWFDALGRVARLRITGPPPPPPKGDTSNTDAA